MSIMDIWAIADLHLAFGAPEKSMEVFGDRWKDYQNRIEQEWRAAVKKEDLVLIAGDISWSKTFAQAQTDLNWIHSLPGKKVMIRGNHDYWWGSLSKMRSEIPDSIHLIQNDAFNFEGISIGGSRLWDTAEYTFDNGELKILTAEELREQEKIFKRELERLEMSLKSLNQQAQVRIAMTHYPPIGLELNDSRTSTLFERYGVSIAIFGHLHHMESGEKIFGKKNGIDYHLTSADYLKFRPLKIYTK